MARNRLKTDFLVVHCSATTAKMDIGAREINAWHLERGIYSDRGLTGYHFIGRRNGDIELGRDQKAIGAHVRGLNDRSLGYCMVGGVRKAAKGEKSPDASGLIPENNFTADQFDSLHTTILVLQKTYPGIVCIPHSFVSDKACPSFDFFAWYEQIFGDTTNRMAAREMLGEFKEDWE